MPASTTETFVTSLMISIVDPTFMDEVSVMPVTELNPALAVQAVTVVMPLMGRVGASVGDEVGAFVGDALGSGVGLNFTYVGTRVGSTLGAAVGYALGRFEGR